MRRQSLTSKDYRWPTAIFLLVLASCVYRFFFAYAVPYKFSPHDLGALAKEGEAIGRGHLGYVEYIVNFGRLPDFDPRSVECFYNPPLYYILQSLVVHFTHALGFGQEAALKNMQMLTSLFASLSVVISERILTHANVSAKNRFIVLLFLAFHPILTVLGATLNNDSMSIFFILLSVLCTQRFHESGKTRDLLFIALAVSAGMATKLSVALIAPPIAVVLLLGLAKRPGFKMLHIRQLLLFALVSMPIGLYHPIKSLLRFGMPINYVPRLDGIGMNVDAYSLIQRLGLPSKEHFITPYLTLKPAQNFNIFMVTLKTQLFDEIRSFAAPHAELLSYTLLAMGALLTLFLLLSLIPMVRGKLASLRFFFPLSALILLLSYLQFCYLYPQIFTMNFRYIVPLLTYGAVGVGLLFTTLDGRRIRWPGVVFTLFTGAFTLCHMYLYVAYACDWLTR